MPRTPGLPASDSISFTASSTPWVTGTKATPARRIGGAELLKPPVVSPGTSPGPPGYYRSEQAISGVFGSSVT